MNKNKLSLFSSLKMKNLFLFFVLLLSFNFYSQEAEIATTEEVWRVNFLNPAVEYEYPLTDNSAVSAGLGVGYGGSYPDLTYFHSGWVKLIMGFLDVQYKYFYNLEKRLGKGRNISNNSGNFISARLLTRGIEFESNVRRTSDVDFAIGPTWGIQRSYGRFHLLFDIGPVYYFDAKGNGDFYPLIPQLNIGIDL